MIQFLMKIRQYELDGKSEIVPIRFGLGLVFPVCSANFFIVKQKMGDLAKV